MLSVYEKGFGFHSVTDSSESHMTAPPPDARDILPTLPHHTSHAIQRAMAKKPTDRFAAAGEFIMAMGTK